MSIESRSNQYGAIFGDWHIRKLLGSGSGGKSAVFELCRENNGWQEYSALKVVSLIEERGTREEMTPYRTNEYSTAVREQRTQAEQEVRLMEQLRGKTNIVDYLDHQFCDWHEENGFGVDLLIRMEKLTDLRSQLRRGRLFSDREIITIGMDICRALTICHGKNILHRDIKPENIFFNADGDYKLGDFGVSRIMSNASSVIAGTAIGTITYAAPEQFTGQYDHRVDIYSLGLVLYELMNGNRLPFAASGYATQEAIQKRFTGAPIPMPANVNIRDARSAGLVKIIMKATAFYSGNRYQDAREMLRDLTALSGGAAAAAPETAVPSGDSSQTTAFYPVNHTRETAPLQPVSFMPAENGDMYVLPIPPAPAARKTSLPAPAPKVRISRPILIGVLVVAVIALIVGFSAMRILSDATDNVPTPEVSSMPTLEIINLVSSGTGRPERDCQGNVVMLSVPSWEDFPKSKITIENADREEISQDSFIFEWDNGTVHITPGDSLPFGVYHITFKYQQPYAMCSLCYGYEGEIYQEYSVNMGWDYFAFQNWKNERYLVQTDSGLETTASHAERTTFTNSTEMCGIEVGSDGYAHPNNNGGMVRFTTNVYVLHGGKRLWVFTYDGWYMASDSEGRVYFTKTLTSECYWVYAN